MLKLTLEFLPGGNESNQETIGTFLIYNDGSGTDKIGNYKIYYINKDDNKTELPRVLGHKRSQTLGAWVLCREALKVMLSNMRKA